MDSTVWDLAEPVVRFEPLAQKQSPASEKPVNTGPAFKSSRPVRDSGFLSAKDLAAAFKLNHPTGAAGRDRKGHADETLGKADDSSTRFKPSALGSPASSRKSGGKFFFILVVLVWIMEERWRCDPHRRAGHRFLVAPVVVNVRIVPTPSAPQPADRDEFPALPASPEGLAPIVTPSLVPPAPRRDRGYDCTRRASRCIAPGDGAC